MNEPGVLLIGEYINYKNNANQTQNNKKTNSYEVKINCSNQKKENFNYC